MWRVITASKNDAFMNMAVDEAICNYVRDGGEPTIRFYMWNPSAVSIGYFQSVMDEVDVEFCNKNGISVVRRRTGGGAVYHDSHGEITYSVIAPQDMFPESILQSYKMICSWIVDGLESIGINSSFKPINDIIINEKKISGSAQTRKEGVLLQHGTVLYSLNLDTMFRCLKVSDEKIRDKMINSARQRVTCVNDYCDIPIQKLHNSLLNSFCYGKEWRFGELTEKELADANFLAKNKYKTHQWNFWR